ncbi:hypothetical protein ACWCPQ_14515 [Nocardia sp. NPDC001965]
MSQEDLAWVREHMAENPFEPMVALVGTRMYDHGVAAIVWLRHYPDTSAETEFGVDRLIPLV